jgi:hypothetical protein
MARTLNTLMLVLLSNQVLFLSPYDLNENGKINVEFVLSWHRECRRQQSADRRRFCL